MIKSIFTSFCLFYAASSFAQFYDNDAQFNIAQAYFSYSFNSYAESTILPDSSINGTTVNRLSFSGQHIELVGPSEYDTTDIQHRGTLITRTSNDSVYIYRDNEFHLAFMTEGEIGDVWDLGKFPGYETDPEVKDDHAYLKIIDKGDTLVDTTLNISLKFLDTRPCTKAGEILDFGNQVPDFDSLLIPRYSGRFLEKVGPLGGFLSMGSAFKTNVFIEGGENSLLCFNSGATGYLRFFDSKNCYYNIKAGGEELSEDPDFKMFPNPSTGIVRFQFQEGNDDKRVEIYNAMGELVLVKSESHNELELNLSELQAGLYQVVVNNDDGRMSSTRLILQ